MRKIQYILLLLMMSLSLSGQVVYRQDFGGNKVKDDSISRKVFRDCKYKQVFADVNGKDGSEVGTFSVRKKAFYNGNRTGVFEATPSQWYAQDDHTYPNDYKRGYFLQVDGSLEKDLFYSFKVQGFHAGDSVEVSLWVVNIYTQYQRYCYATKHWEPSEPDIDLLVFNRPELAAEIARFRIGPVPFSPYLYGHTDYECSNEWMQYKFGFRVPKDGTLWFVFGNRQIGSPGNDFGIDDIVIKIIK